jgi:pyruvate carboxylase
MEFVVHLDGVTHHVRLEGGACFVDGDPVPLDVASVAPGTSVRSVLHDGRALRLLAERKPGEEGALWRLDLDGVRADVEVLDRGEEAIRRARQASGRVAGPRPLKAPMPGLVVRVEVAPGDEVRAGQGLVIVEAMKMENELKAEAPGRVKAVHVVPGVAVEKDAVLVEFEVPEEDA